MRPVPRRSSRTAKRPAAAGPRAGRAASLLLLGARPGRPEGERGRASSRRTGAGARRSPASAAARRSSRTSGEVRARHFAHRPGLALPAHRARDGAPPRREGAAPRALRGGVRRRAAGRAPRPLRRVPAADPARPRRARRRRGGRGGGRPAPRRRARPARRAAGARARGAGHARGRRRRRRPRSPPPACRRRGGRPRGVGARGGRRRRGRLRAERRASRPAPPARPLARADAERAKGGEAAEIAELEAYRARGLFGEVRAAPREGAAALAPPAIRAVASAARSAARSGPRSIGAALARHACPGRRAAPGRLAGLRRRDRDPLLVARLTAPPRGRSQPTRPRRTWFSRRRGERAEGLRRPAPCVK